MKVPIENIYYLLCYAWRFVPEDLAIDVGGSSSPDVLNLCAHVLTTGIDRLMRRGIDRGYVGFVEETPRLRGRVDLTATITRLTWRNARVVCEFDELSPDILHNRILRTTIRLLSNGEIEPELRNRLHETDFRLSGIDTIPLTGSLFQRVQLHRNNSFYAFLMRVCELVHSSLLPDRSGEGPSWFKDVLSDEEYMAAVFEEFIRNFYSLKQSYFAVGRSHPKWNATAEDWDLRFLPAMTTDVTLSSTSRTIIIDAKYYRDALQTHFQHGSRKVHSSNLYQLLAYLHGTNGPAGDGSLEGMLIYPVGEQAVDLRFKIDSYPIRIYTVNLAQPWSSIETDLLDLIGSTVSSPAG